MELDKFIIDRLASIEVRHAIACAQLEILDEAKQLRSSVLDKEIADLQVRVEILDEANSITENESTSELSTTPPTPFLHVVST